MEVLDYTNKDLLLNVDDDSRDSLGDDESSSESGLRDEAIQTSIYIKIHSAYGKDPNL